jgi:hypothetical protein
VYVDGKLTDKLDMDAYPASPSDRTLLIGNDQGRVTPFAGDIARIRISAGEFRRDELDH